MGSIKELEAQRDSVLEQLRAIRSLERGSISEQYLKGSARGKPVVRGPYYVVSRHEGGRTVSRRLKTREELERARQDVAQHKRFIQLCNKLEDLTGRLGELERSGERGDKKKRFRRRSNRIGRSG